MFIVWGTQNTKQRNVVPLWGECPHCHRMTKLSTFDARRCGHVYGVPLTNHGDYHFLSVCPRCEHCRMIPAREWDAIVRDTLRPAVDAYVAQPDNSQLAVDALSTVTALQHQDGFYEVALGIEQNLTHNPVVLAELARAYSLFKMEHEAVSAFERSLALRADPSVRLGLTLHHCWFAHAAEAAADVHRMIDNGDEHARKLADLHIKASSAIGRHDLAIATMDRLEKRDPSLAGDSKLKSARREAQEYLPKGTRRGGWDLAIAHGGPRPTTRREKRVVQCILGGAAVIAVGIYLMVCAATKPAVYLANGTGRNYEVRVNGGNTVKVLGHSYVRLPADFGELVIEATNADAGFTREQFDVDQSFILRAYYSPTMFIINPDRQATFLYTEATYSSNPAPPRESVHRGMNMDEFHSIECQFTPVPDQIRSDKNSEKRRSVEMIDP